MSPTLSLAVARKQCVPSGSAVVSKTSLYGAAATVPSVLQAPAQPGWTSNITEATPEPASAASAMNSNVFPEMMLPATGCCRLTVGGVLSTWTVTTADVVSMPTPFRAVTLSVASPL